jgi:hypothetical protein
MSNNTNSTIIRDYEQFSPANHPMAIHELSALIQGLSQIAIYFKVEIIVSFLKNHCLKNDWIDANPALTRMITSGFFKTSHLEALFTSYRNNNIFIKDLESYIGKQLLMGRN